LSKLLLVSFFCAQKKDATFFEVQELHKQMLSVLYLSERVHRSDHAYCWTGNGSEKLWKTITI